MATAPKASAKVVPLDDAKAAAPKSNKKTLIIVLAAVLLAAGGGAGAWFFLKGGEQTEEPKVTKKVKHDPATPPVFIPTEPFTVNLQPEGVEQYLQVALTLQVPDQAQVELIKQYMPLVRSRILLLLAGKKPSELSNTEGKEKLQQEIAELVNKPFQPKGEPQEVSAVFFTSFVIQ